MNRTFEILLGSSKAILRCTREYALAELRGKGLSAIKRGYTTWAIYEGQRRVGSMQELG